MNICTDSPPISADAPVVLADRWSRLPFLAVKELKRRSAGCQRGNAGGLVETAGFDQTTRRQERLDIAEARATLLCFRAVLLRTRQPLNDGTCRKRRPIPA